MNFTGIIVGLCTFLIIGLCHPLVIKAEYHLGKGCWWLFLLAGLGFGAVSLLSDNYVWSTVAGVAAFSAFWSILELFEQEKRVRRGWFPENPARKRKQTEPKSVVLPLHHTSIPSAKIRKSPDFCSGW